MRLTRLQLLRNGLSLVTIVALPILGFFAVPQFKNWWALHHHVAESSNNVEAKPHGILVGVGSQTLQLPQEVLESLQVETAEVQQALGADTLKLEGSLFLDANRLVHVNSRFSGDVIELGQVEISDSTQIPSTDFRDTTRSISFGDTVSKGQLLAVIWSKELGEKKSELVECLTMLRFNEERLKRLEDSASVMSERALLDTRHDVEMGLITIAKVERTLRSWRLSAEQIQAIRLEAEKVRTHKGDWHASLDESWARVEIRSPMDGTVVEKNLAVGDFVSTDLDLFKVADLRRLDVLAHVYEEDISLLETLPEGHRRWTIRLKASLQSQPLEGSFQRIGNLIDPAQHTALVMGWVDNSAGRLRAGQFISAQIHLPPDPDEVAIPISALVDREGESRVFVETDSLNHEFTCRRVMPTRRNNQYAYVSTKTDNSEGHTPFDTLKIGERVVKVGGVQMAAELESLRAAARSNNTTAESLSAKPVGQETL